MVGGAARGGGVLSSSECLVLRVLLFTSGASVDGPPVLPTNLARAQFMISLQTKPPGRLHFLVTKETSFIFVNLLCIPFRVISYALTIIKSI